MAAETHFMKKILIKVIVGLVIGGMLVGVAKVFAFPPVFQVMFFIYAMLGATVFILLDAPALGTLGGMKAILGLIAFYIVVSTIYIGGASLLPQFDPQDEMGKIDKLLKVKRERAAHEYAAVDESLQQVKSLDKQVQTLTARLNQLAPAAVPNGGGADAAITIPSTGGTDLIARGKEVYELHECYNCHKIGGQGSVKKRGPVLDNIGSLLTIDDIKKKVFDTTYLYAEGFEKEHKKGLMPDKYKELMTEEELGALAAYLSTLKNPAVETPKPIYVKTKVEHGFTVYGYVRDSSGKPVAGVDVQAKPLKAEGHAGSTKTNPEGYFEIFLHLHNEDSGTKIVVTSKGVSKEIIATYDSNDKVTKRQTSVDISVAS
ncbi:MAG: c-type cytochrome [Nitrospirales bacterium]|nr:c-type cytochrome [Nitrospirales bacterium]